MKNDNLFMLYTFCLAIAAYRAVSCNSRHGQSARHECLLTSSSCHPKIFVKEFSYFLMSCH